jgi:NTE family protein
MAYHAGVLRALEEVGGYCPDDADLIIGTSAGSMVGAALRSGLTTEDLWLASLGEHPTIDFDDANRERPWEQTWESGLDALRRLVGSAYVLQRSVFRFPTPSLPRQLQRLFPGGFFTIADAEEALSRFMPMDWPDKPLWLVTVDVRTGRRVVLGSRDPLRTDLHTAVRASCAIPAFFQPVRVGHRVLVDGGVHSTTNLDLTTSLAPDVIIGVVPMAYDPTSPPRGFDRAIREFSQRKLTREVTRARAKGSRVLLLRPSADDLDAMGGNMMRSDGNEVVTRAAYESAVRQLSTGRAADVLAQLHERVPAQAV